MKWSRRSAEAAWGEVWKARDARLNRDVAIKVSTLRFTDRFEREARAIAALNHPNICTLFDIGPNYLVMELVEGSTLARRIGGAPIPTGEALAIAKQVAGALEAAHDKGIVHRDLKPANIKVKPDGTVKVLDFGLAKAVDQHAGNVNQSTTREGTILGTAAYMAPEQAQGRPAGKQADIWSFGVTMYEMVTGRRPFQGQTTAGILASVIKEDPDLDEVPARLRLLLRSCLRKDPKDRLQAIGDWRLLIDDTLDGPAATRRGKSVPVRQLIGVVALAIVALLVAALSFMYFHGSSPLQQAARLSVLLPEKSRVLALAVSPDGREIAMVLVKEGKQQIWMRALDALEPTPLAGTDEATDPFWSPDSRYLAFFADARLKKIGRAGGPVQTLCDALGALGGTWNRNGIS
jgi:hypothetical protein